MYFLVIFYIKSEKKRKQWTRPAGGGVSHLDPGVAWGVVSHLDPHGMTNHPPPQGVVSHLGPWDILKIKTNVERIKTQMSNSSDTKNRAESSWNLVLAQTHTRTHQIRWDLDHSIGNCARNRLQ